MVSRWFRTIKMVILLFRSYLSSIFRTKEMLLLDASSTQLYSVCLLLRYSPNFCVKMADGETWRTGMSIHLDRLLRGSTSVTVFAANGRLLILSILTITQSFWTVKCRGRRHIQYGIRNHCKVVAEPRISSKSAKSREIHKNTRNPAKFARNLTKYMSAQHIWKLSWLLGLFTCCKLANLPWNFVTAAIPRVNKIPKLPGVLKLKPRRP